MWNTYTWSIFPGRQIPSIIIDKSPHQLYSPACLMASRALISFFRCCIYKTIPNCVFEEWLNIIHPHMNYGGERSYRALKNPPLLLHYGTLLYHVWGMVCMLTYVCWPMIKHSVVAEVYDGHSDSTGWENLGAMSHDGELVSYRPVLRSTHGVLWEVVHSCLLKLVGETLEKAHISRGPVQPVHLLSDRSRFCFA